MYTSASAAAHQCVDVLVDVIVRGPWPNGFWRCRWAGCTDWGERYFVVHITVHFVVRWSWMGKDDKVNVEVND